MNTDLATLIETILREGSPKALDTENPKPHYSKPIGSEAFADAADLPIEALADFMIRKLASEDPTLRKYLINNEDSFRKSLISSVRFLAQTALKLDKVAHEPMPQIPSVWESFGKLLASFM